MNAPRLVHVGPFGESAESVLATNRRLLAEIESICARTALFRLLILIRKVPFSLVPALLGRGAQKPQRGDFRVFMEGLLFATNCILRCCVNPLDVAESRLRNFLKPSPTEMEDAVRLTVLAVFHRHNLFYLNSMARASLAEGGDLAHLIQIYNERQLLRSHETPLAKAGEAQVVMLTPAQSLPVERYLSVQFPGAPTIRLRLENYFPFPVGHQSQRSMYAYLECPDFEERIGMCFAEAWACWLGLNHLSLRAFPVWESGKTFKISAPLDEVRVEKFFDLCETGLGSGSISDLKDACHPQLVRSFEGTFPSKEKFASWIDRLTCERIANDPEFVEIPYVFYRIGPNAILWDHARHGGVWKAIARNLVQVSGTIGRQKGGAFEEAVVERLRNAGFQAIKNGVKIRERGRVVLEIDIGLVNGEVLYLIELKHRFKPRNYYSADGPVVASHIQKLERELERRDEGLRRYGELVREKWKHVGAVGAIYLFCTDEAEFIPSLGERFWIALPLFPRLCRVEELVRLLKSDAHARVTVHPQFVRFN